MMYVCERGVTYHSAHVVGSHLTPRLKHRSTGLHKAQHLLSHSADPPELSIHSAAPQET